MEQNLHYNVSVRLFAEEKCFGPGIAALLHRVQELHSLRAAAMSMGMAYSKAWTITKHAERQLGFPLLHSSTGGKAVNPLNCEGQIEGGVVMSMGYALTEQYPLDHGKPTAKYGTLGLFRSHQIPEIKAIVIDKPGLNLANGAIGIGEITSIPTAPAIAQAYYRYDGERRRSLPLDHTPYKK